MNPSADEETLSAVEVSKTNQVTVATVTTTIATVTTTSTTNTQTVAGIGACYIPLLTGYAPQQALPNYSTNHQVTSKVLLITKNTPLTF